MSNELTRYGRMAMSKRDETLKHEAGKALMTVGTGGLVLGGVAYLLPFVTLPFVLLAAVLLGCYLYAK